jgi:hypothetical protein
MDKYFGIADEEREDSSRVPKILPIPTGSELQGPIVDEDDGDELMLTFEEMLVAESVSDVHPIKSFPLPTDPPTPMPLQGQGIHANDYLLYKGHWMHKQMICHLVINKDFKSKSFN